MDNCITCGQATVAASYIDNKLQPHCTRCQKITIHKPKKYRQPPSWRLLLCLLGIHDLPSAKSIRNGNIEVCQWCWYRFESVFKYWGWNAALNRNWINWLWLWTYGVWHRDTWINRGQMYGDWV